jgi:hypothetical protein
MFLKTILIISLAVASIYSRSVENAETTVDCDALYSESGDDSLSSFIQRHGLKTDYERRNDSFDSCFQFLGKFILKIDQYRDEEGKQDDLKLGHLKQLHKRVKSVRLPKSRFFF